MSARVLVIAWDAAEPALLERWAAAGLLPTWRTLLEQGALFRIQNPPGLYVGAVWPSLFTGVSPSRHHYYCFEQLVAGTYDVLPPRSDEYGAPPFWASLARANRRVALVDVPKSPPADSGVALHVVDWGTHDPEAHGFHTTPAPRAGDIALRYGSDPVGVCDSYGYSAEGVGSLRERLLRRVQTKTQLCLDALGEQDWDLFFAVFGDSHCAGHQFWRLHDAGHPAHDAALVAEIGNPLLDVYRELDASLGRLLGACGPETTLLVFSSHGMGPHYDANFLLPELLLALQGTGSNASRGQLWVERGWRALPESARQALRPLTRRLADALRARRAVPGNRTLAELLRTPASSGLRYFAVPNNDAHGGIRFNLVGREPHGRVEPGPDVDRAVEEIRAGLADFVNEDSGQPILEALWRIEQLYPGEVTGALPDLIVDWRRDFPVRAALSPRFGRVTGAPVTPRTGDHRPEGLVVARGPGIVRGRRPEAIRSVDLAPTVARLLGVAPAGFDGRPIEGVGGA